MVVGIVGVGLIGGSIGYILKKKRWASKVIGIGRNEDKLKLAIDLNAIDEYLIDFTDKIKELDILILAVPVNLISKFAKDLLPFLKKGAIITDVGSTKKSVTSDLEEMLPDDIIFIGGHPMAGSEKTGAAALDPYLFENAIYVLTQSKVKSEEALKTVISMVETLGANPLIMEADTHDLSVAAISHLPQIAASSLVLSVGEIDNKHDYILPLAAGGFRDTTRIASSDPKMWKDICTTNSDKILSVLSVFEDTIKEFKEAIAAGDVEKIEELFHKGKTLRDHLPKKKKGILTALYELVVYVPDTPGVIGRVAEILGANNINIKDIEVLHVRENEGGSIRIGLDMNGNEKRAVDLLKNNGFEVKVLE